MGSSALLLWMGIVFNAGVWGGEVYTSVAKLKQLPEIERKLIEACDRYLDIRPNTPGLEDIKRFLSSARVENRLALSDPAYLENPVNGFRFLWRLVDGWQRATRIRCSSDCGHISGNTKKFLQQVRASIDSVSSWPNHEDISGSAVAITSLLHTYDLDPGDFAKGKLLHTATAPLGGEELLVLAEEVYHHQSMRDAQTWLNRSIARLERMRGQEKLLREAHYKLRDIEEKVEARKRQGLPIKDAPDILYKIGDDEDVVMEELQSKRTGMRQSSSNRTVRGFYQSVYEELCRRDRKTPTEKASLVCWNKNTFIPYLKVKVELLNVDPAIFLFHDVISDNEIEKVKNISMNLLWKGLEISSFLDFPPGNSARNGHYRMEKWDVSPVFEMGRSILNYGFSVPEKLKRSLLGKSDGSGQEGMKERISQSAWIFDDTEVTPQLSRRVELITGLSTRLQRTYSHAEAFQVLNYGLGGMYEPHEDSVRMYRKLGYEKSPAVRNSGDRLATWLFYMSDVTAGGATVFPLLNTRVPVSKGTAAFWYNLKRNGKADTRMIHAGCPVLIGDKWVANKWIREIGQTFRRRCSLNPDE